MTPRPTTFGELLRRLSPNGCAHAPIVASAVELDGQSGSRRRAFWVLLHSATDGGIKLFHAKAVHAKNLSIRIQVESGEVIQALLTVAHSCSRGGLYETTAEFQRVSYDVGQLA